MLNRIYERESTEQVKLSSIIGETLGEISHNDQLLLKLTDQETIKVKWSLCSTFTIKIHG